MITANSELKALKRLTNSIGRVTIKEALNELVRIDKTLFDRRCKTNEYNLERELLMCDIRRCNEILKEIT